MNQQETKTDTILSLLEGMTMYEADKLLDNIKYRLRKSIVVSSPDELKRVFNLSIEAELEEMHSLFPSVSPISRNPDLAGQTTQNHSEKVDL